MPFYTRPVSQLDTNDLQELLTEQAVENIRLEFKLLEPDKDDTLKKLSSFANTFGGYKVIGARADSKDGRLLDLPGVLSARRKLDDHQFKVGDPVSIALHAGRIVDGTVKAIVERTDGIHLQVDYGNDETALVELWRVRPR